MENFKPSKTPTEPRLRPEDIKEEKTENSYRELMECLSYVVMVSRPDLCYAVNYIQVLFKKTPSTPVGAT